MEAHGRGAICVAVGCTMVWSFFSIFEDKYLGVIEIKSSGPEFPHDVILQVVRFIIAGE